MVVKPDGDAGAAWSHRPTRSRSSSSMRSDASSTAAFLSSASAAEAFPVIAEGEASTGRRAVIDKGYRIRPPWCRPRRESLRSPPTSTRLHALGTKRNEPWRRQPRMAARTDLCQRLDGPKVEAVCRFVEETGERAAIGRLEDILAHRRNRRHADRADGPRSDYRSSRAEACTHRSPTPRRATRDRARSAPARRASKPAFCWTGRDGLDGPNRENSSLGGLGMVCPNAISRSTSTSRSERSSGGPTGCSGVAASLAPQRRIEIVSPLGGTENGLDQLAVSGVP